MDKHDFILRRPEMIGETMFSTYAVLVPIIDSRAGASLLFERRSHTLRRQPGEICFPGGKLEPDETPLSCAMRETAEELAINPAHIDLLGPGDIFISPFHTKIHPYIGQLNNYSYSFNPAEVSEIITIPVDFFLQNQPEKFGATLVRKLPQDFPYNRIPGGENYPWANGTHDVLFYQYRNHLIWGITALLVQSAAKLIDQYHLI